MENKIDWRFLIFLVLITSQFIPLKVIGLGMILLLRFRATFKRKINKLSFFYLAFLFYSIILGIPNVLKMNYIYPFLLTIFFSISSFICITQIHHFTKTKSQLVIEKTIRLYFDLNIALSFGQFVLMCIEYKTINPFSATLAAGDNIIGFFSRSPVNMMICSFFVLYFYYKSDWLRGIFALLVALLTGFMSGLVIFVFSITCFLVFLSNLKLKTRVFGGAIAVITLVGYLVFSPGNFDYAMKYIQRIGTDDTPFKLISFYKTAENAISTPKSFLIGEGPANFSSREAFMASGDYLEWYPKSKIYISEKFKDNHLKIWQHDFWNPWDNRKNIANQPFSTYNRFLGEYGLLGLVFFVVGYIFYFLQRRNEMTFGKVMLIMLLLYLFMDYWFQYLSVIIIFELLVLADIKTKVRG